jgi:hypothetical protein
MPQRDKTGDRRTADLFHMPGGWRINLRDSRGDVDLQVRLTEGQVRDIMAESVRYLDAEITNDDTVKWLYGLDT